MLQKDPLRRPAANDLLEIVPDIIEFLTESNLIETTNEFESGICDQLNRLVSKCGFPALITIF